MQNTPSAYMKIFLTGALIFLTCSLNVAKADSEQSIKSHMNEVFHSSQSPVGGNPKGDVTIVDFFDYQCTHCGTLSKTLDSLLKKDANIRIVFKELPILGEESEAGSKAALAAAKQNQYLAFHHRLMGLDASLGEGQIFNEEQVLKAAKQAGLNITQLKQDMNSKAIAQEIKNNLSLSQKIGINGTPTLIIAKNVPDLKEQKIYVIAGEQSESQIQDILRKIRAV